MLKMASHVQIAIADAGSNAAADVDLAWGMPVVGDQVIRLFQQTIGKAVKPAPTVSRYAACQPVIHPKPAGTGGGNHLVDRLVVAQPHQQSQQSLCRIPNVIASSAQMCAQPVAAGSSVRFPWRWEEKHRSVKEIPAEYYPVVRAVFANADAQEYRSRGVSDSPTLPVPVLTSSSCGSVLSASSAG
ncbi:hypothetical protein ACKU5V_027445 [Klebsiella pneumoniae]